MKARQIASFSGKEEKIVTVKQYRWKILKNYVCLSSRLQRGYNGVERAEFQCRE
jgi:hypothetical protein